MSLEVVVLSGPAEELMSILKKYGVRTVSELAKKIEKGEVEEHPAYEDYLEALALLSLLGPVEAGECSLCGKEIGPGEKVEVSIRYADEGPEGRPVLRERFLELCRSCIARLFGTSPKAGIEDIPWFWLEKARCDVYVIPVKQEVFMYAARIAEQLRNKGVKAELELGRSRLKDALSKAVKFGAKFAVIVGPKEIQEEKVVVRNLVEKSQDVMPIGEAVDVIARSVLP